MSTGHYSWNSHEINWLPDFFKNWRFWVDSFDHKFNFANSHKLHVSEIDVEEKFETNVDLVKRRRDGFRNKRNFDGAFFLGFLEWPKYSVFGLFIDVCCFCFSTFESKSIFANIFVFHSFKLNVVDQDGTKNKDVKTRRDDFSLWKLSTADYRWNSHQIIKFSDLFKIDDFGWILSTTNLISLTLINFTCPK